MLHERRHLWTTRLAFGSPDLSTSLLFATVNGWLLFYLISIIGMPPLAAGSVFVLGRLLDGMLDPYIGALTDRHGRKRVIVGALPGATLAFVGLWAAAFLFEDPVAQTLSVGVAFAVFAVGYTCVAIPRLGMLSGLFPGYHDRTGQTGVDMAFVFIAVLISSVAFPASVARLSTTGALSDSQGSVWIAVAAGIGLLAVLAYLPFVFMIREPARPPASASVSCARPGIVSVLIAVGRTDGARRTLALFGCCVLALVTLQSILPFWLEAGPEITAGGQSIILLVVFMATLASLPGWAYLSKFRGKHAGLRLGISAFLAGILLAMLLPKGSGLSPQLFVAALSAGAGTGALSLFPWSMIPDVAEAHSNRLGFAVEGTTTAAFTMTNKGAAAAALFLNAAILQVGANFGLATETPTLLLALPALFACAAFILSRPPQRNGF